MSTSRRRSVAVSFSALTLAAGTTLSACGQPQSAPAPRAQEAAAAAEAQAETGFASLEECRAAAQPGLDCDAAWTQAQAEHAATAPAFADQQQCEAEWGEGQCQTAQRNGGSVFIPLLAGFLIGRALTGGGMFGARPLYRDRNGGYYGGGYGGRTYYGSGGLQNGRFQPSAGRTTPYASAGRTTTARGGFGTSASGRSVGG